MRVLNVTQTYAPFLEFGGPPVKVRALSEVLVRLGHQVTVLTADWGVESHLPALRNTIDRSPFGWRYEENGVQAIYLPTWLSYHASTWNPAVKRFCRARLQNFDVVHIFGLYDLLGPAVGNACRSRNIPYVVEPIGMFIPIVRGFWLKRLYHAFWGRALLGGARFVVATSDLEAAELAAAGVPREKIFLRRNGVEVPTSLPEPGTFRAANGVSPEVKLILFLGRLSQKKSPDLLVQAFAELRHRLEGKGLRLVLVGPDDDGMKSQLMQMAERLGVASQVQFCGPLYGEAKWAAYRDADVFVLPSQNENFGNTAAEAAAAGTPVVVTGECGIAPLLADVAGLVVRHEAGAICAAMERILIEPGLHARLTAGCREVTSRLGWEEPARAMETLYRQVVGAESHVA
jgi:glycosyltransferase involved in cell wall biosynthesis